MLDYLKRKGGSVEQDELADALGLTLPQARYHLKVLHGAGLIDGSASPVPMIAADSMRFLIGLFTELRDNAKRQSTDSENAEIFEALLAGLQGGGLPSDVRVREYVAGLAQGTDEANDYERAELEHRALRELGEALDPYSCS